MKEATTEDVKKVLLAIMDSIDSFCRENGIVYYLYYGSLLGAVRHQGFIPWDDDMDIAMPRADYERFIRLFNQKTAGRYRTVSIDDETKYCYAFAKVIDTGTLLVEETAERIEMGIYVDVFPIDVVPADPARQQKLLAQTKRYIDLFNAKIIPVRRGRCFWKNGLLVLAHVVLSGIKLESIARKIVSLNASYADWPGEKCAANMTLLVYGGREVVDPEWLRDALDTPFEGRTYRIPAGYDSVLRKLYGNYMELPPVEKRVTHHHYKAYMK